MLCSLLFHKFALKHPGTAANCLSLSLSSLRFSVGKQRRTRPGETWSGPRTATSIVNKIHVMWALPATAPATSESNRAHRAGGHDRGRPWLDAPFHPRWIRT